jgi:hypothetical protein
VSGRRLPADDVDRLLREALADDLPEELEGPLRREARLAWRRAASEPRRARWPDWLGIPAAGKPALPQPALVVAALAMLGAGAVMQAAPAPREVVESFQGRQASARVAQALGRATAMECAVEIGDERGRRVRYRVDWRAPGEARVRADGAGGTAGWVLRLPGAGPSVLTQSAAERDRASLDPAVEPARAYLSPVALGERLAAAWRPGPAAGVAPGTEVFHVGPRSDPPGLTVAIDIATHLPLRLDATGRDGRTQAAVCRWP